MNTHINPPPLYWEGAQRQLFSWLIGNKRSALKSLLWSLLIVLASSAMLHTYIIAPRDFTQVYPNTLYQLSAAINANLCHTQHFIDPTMKKLKKKNTDLNIRLFDLPKLSNPSLTAYCAHTIVDVQTAIKILHNREVEESLPLYWLDRTIIMLFGNITLYELEIIFTLMQIALTGLFAFYLLTIGIRWPTVWVMTSLAIIIDTNKSMVPVDVHGLVLPCVLSLIALYGLSYRFGLYRRLLPHILLMIVVTSLEFWLYYARSSELFAILFVLILYSILLIKKVQAKGALISLLVVKCVIIILLTSLAAIELGPKATNKAHPVMHMLVLGMVNPPNDFAKEKGIIWRDMNNLKFAQEINPHIDTLYTHEYNAAISKYYVLLWKNNTKDMLALYNLKFSTIIKSVIDGLSTEFKVNYGANVSFLFYPFMMINGYVFIIMLGLGALFLLWSFWRTTSNINYLTLALTTLALLNLLEGIIIIAIFRYLTTFLFYFLTLIYVFWGTVLYGIGIFFMNLPKKSLNRN